MSLLTAKDSFAMFLATALANESIPFQWLMKDPTDPSLARLKINAVNLYYLSEYSSDTLDVLRVSVDIIQQNERTALIWQDFLTNLFRTGGIIKNKKYTVDPSNPTDEYGNVFWDIRDMNWVIIAADDYCHYNCTFDLNHTFAII